MATKDDIILGLQRKVDQQAELIKELESKLYKAELRMESVDDGVEAIVEKADQLRQVLVARLEAYADMLRYHHPPIMTALPLWHNLREVGAVKMDKLPVLGFLTKTPPDETRKQLESQNPDTALVHMDKEAIWVGVTISFLDGTESGQLFNEDAIFPGTKEEAFEALAPYMISILKIAPLPEDLAIRDVLGDYGGLEEPLLSAMRQISSVYYVDHVAERLFDNTVNAAFEAHILPVLPKELTPNQIRDAQQSFSATVNASFKRVIKRRWPKLGQARRHKPGPKPK